MAMILARAKDNYGYPARRGIIVPVVEDGEKDEEVWPKDGPNAFVIAKGRLYRVEERLCQGEKAMFDPVEEKESIGEKKSSKVSRNKEAQI